MKYHRPVRRRRFHWVVVFMGCVVLVFTARHAFVGLLANWALHHFYPKEQGAIATYDSARWNGRVLSLSDIDIETPAEKIQIEKIELTLGLTSHIWFIRPHWTIKEHVQGGDRKKTQSFLFLLRTFHLDVVEGKCTILPSIDHLEERRFSFSLESLENDAPNMRLACFEELEAQDSPFFESFFSLYKEHIGIEAYSKAASVKELVAITHLFLPRFCEQLETAKGTCNADIQLHIDRQGRLLSLEGTLSASGLLLENNIKGWQVGADAFEVAIYSSKKKGAKSLETEAAISGGSFHLLDSQNDYRFVDLAGYITWLKEKDPKFHLEGQLILGKNSEKVLIDGNGSFDEQEGLRIDSQFSLGEKTQLIASGDMSIVSKLEEIAIDVQLQHAEFPFLKHISDVIGWTSPEQFIVHSGVVQGNGLFKIKQGELVKIELAPLHLINTNFGKDNEFSAKSLTLSIDGKWHVLPEIGWQIKRCKGVIQSGSVDLNQWKSLAFHNLSGECYIEQGQIEESTFKAQIMDVPLELEISGSWKNPSGILYASTNWNNFVDILSSCGFPLQKEIDFKEGVEIACEFKPLCNGYATHLQVLAGSEGKAKSTITFADNALQKGHVKVSKFPVHLLYGFFFKELQGRGIIDGEGIFDDRGGSARFSLSEMSLESPQWALETISKTQGDITWGDKGRDMKIYLPLSSPRFYFKEPHFALDNVSAEIIATSRSIEMKKIEAMCCGITFKGEALIKDKVVKIASKEIRGSLSDLQPILVIYPEFSEFLRGVQGRFAIKEQDFRLEWPSGNVFFRASLENVFFPLGKFGVFDSVSTKILYNSQKGLLCFEAIEGDLRLRKGEPLRIELQPIELRMKEEGMVGVVAGSIKSETFTLLDAFGYLRVSQGDKILQLDPSKSRLLGCPLEKAFVQIKDDGMGLSLSGTYDFEKTPHLVKLVPQENFTFPMRIPLKGICSYQITWDSKAQRWEGGLQSQQLSINGAKINQASLRASKDSKRLSLEQVVWDDCKASVELALDRSSNLPFTYHFNSPSLKSSGEGTINLSQQSLEVLPRFEISRMGQSCVVRTQRPISIDFTHKGEIVAKEVKCEEPATDSWVEIPKIRWSYAKDRLEVETMNFKVSSLAAKKWLPDLRTSSGWFEGSMNCLWHSSTEYEIEGRMQDGEYGWGDWLQKGKAIKFRWIPNHLLIGMKALLEGNVLTGTLQLDLHDQLALLKVQKQGQDTNLNMFFRLRAQKMPIIEKLSGECFGIRADLKSSQAGSYCLVGKIAIDFGELLTILPAKSRQLLSKFKLGNGFSFEGEIQIPSLRDWKADGVLKGKECVLFHTVFSHLESAVTFSPKQLLFKQASVKEAGLSVTIPQLKIETPREGTWTLQCPLLQMNDLQPSRLRKLDEKENTLKPFVIRNLTLSDVFGELNQLESFRGDCLLQFTNAVKKESGLLDIPLNLLKDLGLEPSLLIPLQGELVGHLERGRLLFTEMKGAYSEGRRTHFILAGQGDGSYVDFDGKLHIDLLMKQAVMLKIAESLTLGIRGNLEKPRYVLLP